MFGGFALLLILIALLSPPAGFPVNALLSIPKGTSLEDALKTLHTQHIIRSPLLTRIVVVLTAGERGVVAGDYIFHEPRGVIGVTRAITSGLFGFELTRMTIPEGTRVSEIAELLDERFLLFDAQEFRAKAQSLEGYLFPDTYYFLENVTADQIIRAMR